MNTHLVAWPLDPFFQGVLVACLMYSARLHFEVMIGSLNGRGCPDLLNNRCSILRTGVIKITGQILAMTVFHIAVMHIARRPVKIRCTGSLLPRRRRENSPISWVICSRSCSSRSHETPIGLSTMTPRFHRRTSCVFYVRSGSEVVGVHENYSLWLVIGVV